MVKARIELDGDGELWRVKETYVNYDDEHVEQMGPIERWLEYEEAIKEAKRWTLLQLRHRGRPETEDDIAWTITPEFPVRHLDRL